MKSPTALAQQSYLVAPLVEFDTRQKALVARLSPLLYIGSPLAVAFQYAADGPLKIAGLGLVLGCVGAGLYGMFGIKAYARTGLLELSRDGFTIARNGKEIRMAWTEPTAVTLVYLTEDGDTKAESVQTERCWLGYMLGTEIHLHYFLLTFNEMGRSITNLARDLQQLHPQVKTINAFGRQQDELIDLEKARYRQPGAE